MALELIHAVDEAVTEKSAEIGRSEAPGRISESDALQNRRDPNLPCTCRTSAKQPQLVEIGRPRRLVFKRKYRYVALNAVAV